VIWIDGRIHCSGSALDTSLSFHARRSASPAVLGAPSRPPPAKLQGLQNSLRLASCNQGTTSQTPAATPTHHKDKATQDCLQAPTAPPPPPPSGYGYRCPISTRPASPARSPFFGPGPSPARPGYMRARTGPARISGPGSDKILGTMG
jgi:hypothetical protein